MSAEHTNVAIAVATEITNKLVSVLPAIQEHLQQGRRMGGLNVQINFRAGGGPGEGPVVVELELNTLAGAEFAINLMPSPATGDFMLMQQPSQPLEQAVQMPPPIQYPPAQNRLPPAELVQRTPPQQMPPNWQAPPDQPGLTGQMGQVQAPPNADPKVWAAHYNQGVQEGQWQEHFNQPPSPPPVTPITSNPGRITRPMFPGE